MIPINCINIRPRHTTSAHLNNPSPKQRNRRTYQFHKVGKFTRGIMSRQNLSPRPHPSHRRRLRRPIHGRRRPRILLLPLLPRKLLLQRLSLARCRRCARAGHIFHHLRAHKLSLLSNLVGRCSIVWHRHRTGGAGRDRVISEETFMGRPL